MAPEIQDSLPPAVNQPAADQSVRLQYSVRDLLAAMFVLSIALAVLFGFPGWFASATIMVASILMLAVLTAAVVYGRGDTRAFCIGALFPAFLVAVAVACLFVVMTFDGSRRGFDQVVSEMERYAGGMRFAIIAGWPMAIVAGALSIVVRRQLQRGHDST